jgi:hypothetical protein
MASRCVFCGAKPTTKEHIYPKWLRKVVTGDSFITVLETKAGRKVKRPQVGFDLTVNAVCRTCNSGWMSTLENTARPVLTAMIRGEPCVLDAHDQRLVATWVHKTMLMMYQQAPASDVPLRKAHYLAMYRDKMPPPGTLVALAAQTDTLDGPVSQTPSSMDHQVISESNVVGVPAGTTFYSAFLAIGAFGAILMSNADGEVACPFPDEAGPFLVPVWPTTESVSWPPASSDALGQVSGLYYGMYPSPNPLPDRDESFRRVNRPSGPSS